MTFTRYGKRRRTTKRRSTKRRTFKRHTRNRKRFKKTTVRATETYAKIRFSDNIDYTTSVAGAGSWGFALQIDNPFDFDYTYIPANTPKWTALTTGQSNVLWNHYASLFKWFRCCGIKIAWTPLNTYDGATNSTQEVLTERPYIYMDSNALTPNETITENGLDTTIHFRPNMRYPWSKYYKIKNAGRNAHNSTAYQEMGQWTSTQNTAAAIAAQSGGVLTMVQPFAIFDASLQAGASDLYFGQWTVTKYYLFKTRSISAGNTTI